MTPAELSAARANPNDAGSEAQMFTDAQVESLHDDSAGGHIVGEQPDTCDECADEGTA